MARRKQRLRREAAARAVVRGDRRARQVGEHLVRDDEREVRGDERGERAVERRVVLRHHDRARRAGARQRAQLRDHGAQVAAAVEDRGLEPGRGRALLHRLRHAHGGRPEQVAGDDAEPAGRRALAAHEHAAPRATLDEALVHERLHRAAHGHAREAALGGDRHLGADPCARRKGLLRDALAKTGGQFGIGGKMLGHGKSALRASKSRLRRLKRATWALKSAGRRATGASIRHREGRCQAKNFTCIRHVFSSLTSRGWFG